MNLINNIIISVKNYSMKKLMLLFFSISFVVIFSPSAYGLLNPAQLYCEALGYTYSIISTDEGERGVCELPIGSVDSWDFLKGKIATEYSYCVKMGYKIKTTTDESKCLRLFTSECAVCVLENGTEIEVTELMGLSLEETTCGDGLCGFPENYNTCPSDCPSGSYDGYCDGVEDGICDQDCVDDGTPEKDPDCPICGDGKCDEGENYENCPEDCAPEVPVKPICGNNKCEPGETQENCCIDCGCPEGMKCIEMKCVYDFETTNRAWIYVVIGVIIVTLIIVILIKSRWGE